MIFRRAYLISFVHIGSLFAVKGVQFCDNELNKSGNVKIKENFCSLFFLDVHYVVRDSKQYS